MTSMLPKLLLASVLSSVAMVHFASAAEPVSISEFSRLPEIRQVYKNSFKPENSGQKAWWMIDKVDTLFRNAGYMRDNDEGMSDEAYVALDTTKAAFQMHLAEQGILAAQELMAKVRNEKGNAEGQSFRIVQLYLKSAGLDIKTDAGYAPIDMTRQQFKDFRAAWAEPHIRDRWSKYQDSVEKNNAFGGEHLRVLKEFVRQGYDIEDEDKGYAVVGQSLRSIHILEDKAMCPVRGPQVRNWLCRSEGPKFE